MSFDNSRFTFNPWNDYSGVVMEQGRVQTDADWNEWLAELSRRIQAGTFDTLGHAVYPVTTPFAFQITPTSPGGTNTISIGRGRMYVDGLLAENHGLLKYAAWDSALDELSGSPQPPSTATADPNPLDFGSQPYLPGATVPTGSGPFLAYLDLWTRPITYIEDSELIDMAIGVDTAGRLQTVWQVKLMPVPASASWNCQTPDSSIQWPPTSAGQLTVSTVPTTTSGPCCMTTGSGYTGAENQFYRVEIHQPGAANALGATSGASFKWSRENASVETGVTAIANATNSLGDPAMQLSVVSLGRDQVLGFTPGNWIEVLDDTLYLNGQPGELCLIDSIDFSGKTITLTAPLTNAAFAVGTPPATANTRIRRWDQSGKVYEQDGQTVWCDLGASAATGDIPVPASGTTLILENGITVTFNLSSASGTFLTGDFWNFAARTATGALDPPLNLAAPRGIYHHYTKLAFINFPNGTSDCRNPWPPASTGSDGSCGCCSSATVGDNVNSFGQYTSIQAAIDSLTAGGEVSILPGRYYENVLIQNQNDLVIHGCGWQTRVASQILAPAGSPQASGATKHKAPSPGNTTGNDFEAVFTITASEHVVLRGFAIEAASGEVGVLIDGTGDLFSATDETLTAADTSTTETGSGTGTQAATPSGAQAHMKKSKSAAGKTLSKMVDAQSSDLKVVVEKGATQGVLAGAQSGSTSGMSSSLGIDVALEDLIVTASTLPAILACEVELLKIADNRIAMKNLPSQWPAVWVSGEQILITHNWIGLQSTADDLEWLPDTVQSDLKSPSTGTTSGQGKGQSKKGAREKHTPGGILIAGPATGVQIVENQIEGGKHNGITLGNFISLDDSGNGTGTIIGSWPSGQDECATSFTLEVPAGSKLAAGPTLIDILIARNTITEMGMCGIGPIGFFNLQEVTEIISIEGLVIDGNMIGSTLLNELTPPGDSTSPYGYGAICVPDAVDLIIRDNIITDFGQQPGADVAGIFILHSQLVEISRNQVIETRDWSLSTGTTQSDSNDLAGGIILMLVEPPSLDPASSALWVATSDQGLPAPLYQPNLPALRVEHNTVRIPVGQALQAVGFGAFSIVNNHLSSGGTVAVEEPALAMAVMVINLGLMIELADLIATFTALYNYEMGTTYPVGQGLLSNSSSGAVLFTNNIIQVEANASLQTGFASVVVFTLDHLTFSNNLTWLDGPSVTAWLDVLLFGCTLQVLGNRLQEEIGSVFYSGVTYGLANITAQNLSTFCLFAEPKNGKYVLSPNNIVLDPQLCKHRLL